jgi:hypothetical protein
MALLTHNTNGTTFGSIRWLWDNSIPDLCIWGWNLSDFHLRDCVTCVTFTVWAERISSLFAPFLTRWFSSPSVMRTKLAISVEEESESLVFMHYAGFAYGAKGILGTKQINACQTECRLSAVQLCRRSCRTSQYSLRWYTQLQFSKPRQVTKLGPELHKFNFQVQFANLYI